MKANKPIVYIHLGISTTFAKKKRIRGKHTDLEHVLLKVNLRTIVEKVFILQSLTIIYNMISGCVAYLLLYGHENSDVVQMLLHVSQHIYILTVLEMWFI